MASVLVVRGARENNLKNIDVTLPLGKMVAITGASGSGKSTLINDILYKALWKRLEDTRALPGDHDAVDGLEHVHKVVSIDQSPIGRNSRSNPATYVGFYDTIRDLFTQAPLSLERDYKPGRFSFNVKGGRCEECQGEGVITTQMYFMPDVEVTCGACKGARFNSETLEVTVRGKTIDDVLNMSIEEGVAFFASEPAVRKKIEVLAELGLGYLTLGQSATTLSGGEAQRIKIASELSTLQRSRHTVYILDEPTTGLHLADVERLLGSLNRLVDAGHTVVLIEHHMDVIKTADHVIDLGPDGGHAGGTVVVSGTPEDVARCKASHTGRFLKAHLDMTDTIRWGVLGTGRIGLRKVIPAMQRGTRTVVSAHRLARSGARRGGGGRTGDREGARIVRRPACRSRHRRDLQPAAESPPRAVDDPRRRGRQARALREADRTERGGGRTADRGPRSGRRADPGGVHGPQPPAVARGP